MPVAMIFAAGLGSRLKPLTDTTPKPLIPIAGRPLIDYTVDNLVAAGYRDLVVNVHHLADQMEAWAVQRAAQGDVRIRISDERSMLLDTGGGLRNARLLLLPTQDPIVVCNADILTNINVLQLVEAYKRRRAFATLAVLDRGSGRKLLFDANDRLAGWINEKTGEAKRPRVVSNEKALSFSGYQVVSPRLIATGAKFPTVFSTIDWYLDLAIKHRILAYRHDGDTWLDVGKPEAIAEAELVVGSW
jgi:NDP-sugar pyrophosphorylase family protein